MTTGSGTWYLVTSEYDSMENHHPYEERKRLLAGVSTEEQAVEAGQALFASLERYRSPGKWGSEYPRDPRVIYEIVLKEYRASRT